MSNNLTIAVRQKTNGRKIVIEFDRDRFEKLAANLGLFSEEFLESLGKAEQEVNSKKIRRLKNLRSLRG